MKRGRQIVVALLVAVLGSGIFLAVRTLVHFGPGEKESVAVRAVAAAPPPLPFEEPAPDTAKGKMREDFLNLREAVREYRQIYGEVPLGPYQEDIALQILSVAPSLKLRGTSLTEAGALVDIWGSPVFFHVQSADRLEMRSAGPDKQLQTYDDIISLPTGAFITERELRHMESADKRYFGYTGPQP